MTGRRPDAWLLLLLWTVDVWVWSMLAVEAAAGLVR